MNRIAAIITASTALTAACATTPATIDTAAETAEIDRVRTDFMAAMAAQDFAALGALSHPEFQQVMPGGRAHLEMFAAATNGPFPPGYRLDIKPTELVIMSEDWAYEYGTTTISYQPDGAEAPIELPNTYLMLLKKQDGAWKPYREVASAMPPPDGWPAD
jgi:ketosteroid isomerase-like protein